MAQPKSKSKSHPLGLLAHTTARHSLLHANHLLIGLKTEFFAHRKARQTHFTFWFNSVLRPNFGSAKG